MLKDKQDKGQISPEDVKRFQDQKLQDQKNYNDAQRIVEGVRQQVLKGQQNMQQARTQSMQQQNVSTPTTTNPMQAATASVNAAMDAAKNQQFAATRPPVAANQSQQQPQTQTQSSPIHITYMLSIQHRFGTWRRYLLGIMHTLYRI